MNCNLASQLTAALPSMPVHFVSYTLFRSSWVEHHVQKPSPLSESSLPHFWLRKKSTCGSMGLSEPALVVLVDGIVVVMVVSFIVESTLDDSAKLAVEMVGDCVEDILWWASECC